MRKCENTSSRVVGCFHHTSELFFPVSSKPKKKERERTETQRMQSFKSVVTKRRSVERKAQLEGQKRNRRSHKLHFRDAALTPSVKATTTSFKSTTYANNKLGGSLFRGKSRMFVSSDICPQRVGPGTAPHFFNILHVNGIIDGLIIAAS